MRIFLYLSLSNKFIQKLVQKKFISNLVLIVLLNLLVKPISIFWIDASVQDRVGDEAYGLYFSLLNLTFLFNILLDLGINNFTTKNIAQYPHIVARYMGKLLSFRLFLFVLYATLVFGIGLGLGYNGKQLFLLSFFVLNQFLTTLISYFRSHFAGLLFFKTEGVISVLDRVLLILFCGFLLVITSENEEFKIEWFIWMQTLCYGITAIVAFLLLIRQIGLPKFSWHWTFSKAIIKKSLPYAILILLMMIYTRSDSVILERLHVNGKYEAGIYAKGYRLLDAFWIFGMIFSSLLFPLFSKLLGHKQSILPLLKTAGNLLIGGSFLIICFCYFNSEFIVNLIYEKNSLAAIPSFKWLMLSFIGMCFSLIFGTLLTADGDLRVLNIFSFIAILINFGLNFLLIPKYGAEGAAFTTFCTQCFIAIIQFVYCAKMFKFKFSFPAIGQYAFFVISIIALFYFIENSSFGNISLLFELVVGTIALFIFKMIDIKGLIGLLKEE